jgi:hypothetical protein
MGSLILAGLTSPMMHGPLFLLTLLAALGCGVIAGVLFAFSSFVMKGLARVPPAQGIASMQQGRVVRGWWRLSRFRTV